MSKTIQLKPLWKENLTHMLGAGSHVPQKKHGYRNHFCASTIGTDSDYISMVEMQEAGLVRTGAKTGEMQFFCATIAGCEAIGLSEAAIKRAMEL